MRPIPAPTFYTDDFILRPIQLRDALGVYRALRDPEMAKFVSVPQPYRFRHALKFCVDSVLGRWRGKRVDYAYILRETGELVGCRLIFKIRWAEPPECESGLWAVRSRWGIKRPVMHIWFPYIFDTLGIHRLIYTVNTRNFRAIGSRKPHPRQSVHEGTLRHAVFHHGEWHDMHIFSQLKSDPGIAEFLQAIREGRPPPD